MIFRIEKILKFLNFPIWTILKICNLANSKKFNVKNFQKFIILKIKKKFNVENSKNLQCGKFENFAFSKILQISQNFQFQKHQISNIVQFRTITNFLNTAISKTIKIP